MMVVCAPNPLKLVGGGVKVFPAGASGKEPAWQCRRHRRCWFHPWVRKIPWRRAWQTTPVFLPGESCGQRSLVGCCLWDHTQLDKTEGLSMRTCTGEGNGNPLQYSCLENPRERGAWRTAVYGVTESDITEAT